MNRWLHGFAVFTAVWTFLLLIAGGLVTGTGSGLAVPDWPLSYGKVMPPMTGGILYEHGHRMVATFVGLLTIVLAVWVWRKERRPWVRMLAAVALGAVVVQGVVGGITVLFLLPVP
ncbi:MAG: COX15/CtaA family protein, partial [Bacteroidetes bacterium]|nr:COX15/CtaA family protein [Bacteroidota bacterium]